MKCLLLGAGKTSIECLKTLVRLKKQVSICLNRDELDTIKEYYSLVEEVILFDKFYKINFSNYDFIVRSPGLSILNPYIKYLKDHNIKLINEMELTYILSNRKGYYIGVTGSNGKSTTVSLLYECIKKETNNVLLAGNIGVPLISFLDKINNYTIIILEMSSFQLEDMHELKFDISCILNLSKNHLDNVTSLDYYYDSKFNITNLQTKRDYLITSDRQIEIKQRLDKLITTPKIVNYCNCILKDVDYKIKGCHNKKNIQVVVSILKILGFEIDYDVIKSFNPLEYHLEEIKKDNFLIVNDSKSTSAEAVKAGIEAYLDKNIILIFGGKNKGGDFSFLNNYKLKKKICFGSLSNEINDIGVDYKNYSLDDCVDYALNNVSENDVILFSCGCASFDLFKDYKERGKYFNYLISK